MQPTGKNAAVTRPALAIKGDRSGLVIDGHVEGIIAHHKTHLTVSKLGLVKGELNASSVTVLGHVFGAIRSDGTVSLARGAHVEGDIVCARLLIEDGAIFKGKIDMLEPPSVTVSNEPARAEPSSRKTTEQPRSVERSPVRKNAGVAPGRTMPEQLRP